MTGQHTLRRLTTATAEAPLSGMGCPCGGCRWTGHDRQTRPHWPHRTGPLRALADHHGLAWLAGHGWDVTVRADLARHYPGHTLAVVLRPSVDVDR